MTDIRTEQSRTEQILMLGYESYVSRWWWPEGVYRGRGMRRGARARGGDFTCPCKRGRKKKEEDDEEKSEREELGGGKTTKKVCDRLESCPACLPVWAILPFRGEIIVTGKSGSQMLQ